MYMVLGCIKILKNKIFERKSIYFLSKCKVYKSHPQNFSLSGQSANQNNRQVKKVPVGKFLCTNLRHPVFNRTIFSYWNHRFNKKYPWENHLSSPQRSIVLFSLIRLIRSQKYQSENYQSFMCTNLTYPEFNRTIFSYWNHQFNKKYLWENHLSSPQRSIVLFSLIRLIRSQKYQSENYQSFMCTNLTYPEFNRTIFYYSNHQFNKKYPWEYHHAQQ